MHKFTYRSSEERNNIISEQLSKGLRLIEEQNLVDGNYLIFGSANEHPDGSEPSVDQQQLMDYLIDLNFRLLMIETGITQ